MSYRMLVALGLVLAHASPALAQDAAPLTATTKGFYGVVLALDTGGIPDAKTRGKLAPYISPGLAGLLAKGEDAEKRYAAATKLQVPPLLEGDIFTSLFEGATAFAVQSCVVEGAKGRCTVALTYASGTDKPAHWTDSVLLVQSAAGWRVDDIAYGGSWPFANKGTLRGSLTFAIQNAEGN